MDDSVVEALIWQGIPVPQAEHIYDVSDIKLFETGLGVALSQIPHKVYTKKFPEGSQVYWKLDRFTYKQEELAEFLISE